jgi:hypothetical protein
MELNILTQIREKFSTNRQRRKRTLGKPKNRNSAQSRILDSLRKDDSSNSGQGRLVVTSVKRRYQIAETPEEILKRLFAESGWAVRRHFNDPDFRIQSLENRTVAFTMRNDNDGLQKYSGVLQAFSKAGSALFKLEGQETVFNANLAGFMAAAPA